jgi:hypothetical protein
MLRGRTWIMSAMLTELAGTLHFPECYIRWYVSTIWRTIVMYSLKLDLVGGNLLSGTKVAHLIDRTTTTTGVLD